MHDSISTSYSSKTYASSNNINQYKDVIENGNSFKPAAQTTTNADGSSTTLIPGPITTDEKTQKKNDVKARNATKTTHKSLLKQMYENFSASSTESLDSIFNRLQKIVSQLSILGENISQEDLNLKFLRSLPSKWNIHVVVWRNKPNLDTMSFDDLYNNFKILEQELTANTQASTASTQVSTANLSDDTIYAFLASQPNGSQLVHEDLEQIHEDDLEEMDLTCQLALLSMRTRKFFQKTDRKITINGSDTTGYDKSKVECFNCHKLGHFARECRGPKNQDNRSRNLDSSKRTINVEEISSKAMLAIDGAVFYWSFMADEKVPLDIALMAFSDSKVHNDKTCSKTCLKSFKTLKTQLDGLRIEFNKYEFNLDTYKRGLASVEEQLVFYKKNEVLFYEQLAVLKRGISYKDSKISVLKSELEKLKQDKESNQLKIEKFDNASKSLDKLIGSQIPYKSRKGLGFVSYNVVPPPSTGLFSPPTIDLSNSGLEEFQQPEFEGYGSKINKSVSKDISNEVMKSPDALLVEELVSNDKLEKKTVFLTVAKINFVTPQQQEKPVRKLTSKNLMEDMLHLEDELKEEELLVLLKVPRKNNMYNVDMKNIVPKESLTCTNSNDFVGTEESFGAGHSNKETRSSQDYIVMPLWKDDSLFDSSSKNASDAELQPSSDIEKKDDEGVSKDSGLDDQERPANNTQVDNDVGPSINTASTNVNTSSSNINTVNTKVTTAPIEATYDDLSGYETEVDMSNITTTYLVSSTPNTRIHKDHSLAQVIGKTHEDLHTCLFACFLSQEEPKRIAKALSDSAWVEAMQEELLQFKLQQPPGFEDPDNPDKVYKVVKALYGLHQAPRAWYETLAKYLLDNGFHRGKIDQTLFIKKQKGDILLVQVYVDDIIFGSIMKELCIEFEKLMHEKFQRSSMGELTFFLGLQVKQKEDGIFISQNKYVADILRKFGFTDVKTASTPMDTEKPLLKDSDGDDGDVYLYRSMIRSLMYLTSFKPDIMFALLDAVDKVLWIHKQDPGLWYALTKSPTIYVSLIEQFWQTATTSTLENGDMEITATIDRKVKVVSEAFIRRHLKLEDSDGISDLPTTEIYEQLALMGYVSNSDKLTFQKGHFSPQWRFLIHTILHCLSFKKTA
ncbi:ribonuclease H-like domain-containing protein [Tanacetum coccineum]